MSDMYDKHGWLIGFKSDGSITTLDNKRITINGSIYRLDNARIPRERGYKDIVRVDLKVDLSYKNELKNFIRCIQTNGNSP